MSDCENFESLRTRFAGSFVDRLGAQFTISETHRVRLSLQLDASHLTPDGGVHAAVLTGLGIAAGAGLAELNLKSGEKASTFQTASNMVGSAKAGETILSTAEAVHLGSKTLVIQSRITDESGDRLLCLVSQTLMRIAA